MSSPSSSSPLLRVLRLQDPEGAADREAALQPPHLLGEKAFVAAMRASLPELGGRPDGPARVSKAVLGVAGGGGEDALVAGLMREVLEQDGQFGLTCMSWIAGGGEDPDVVFPELRRTHGEKNEDRCTQVWATAHSAYRCLTCGLSDSSCMCVFCFDPEDHVGHDFRFYTSYSGGCCDCGDPLAWRESGFCKHHSKTKRAAAAAAAAAAGHFPEAINPAVLRGIRLSTQAVCAHLMWLLRACFYFPSAAFPPDKTYASQVLACVSWLDALAQLCTEARDLVCAASLRGQDDPVPRLGRFLSSMETSGDGTQRADFLLAALKADWMLDANLTTGLIRVGSLFSAEVTSEIGAFFLRLLLSNEYKEAFTLCFIRVYPQLLDNVWKADWADVLNKGAKPRPPWEPERERGAAIEGVATAATVPAVAATTTTTDATNNAEGEGEGEGGTEEEGEEGEENAGDNANTTTTTNNNNNNNNNTHDSDQQQQPAPPRALHDVQALLVVQQKIRERVRLPNRFSRSLVSVNQLEFLNRIFCQLFHSEQVVRETLDLILPAMLNKMREIFCVDIEGEITMDMNRFNLPNFMRSEDRLLGEIRMMLHHPSAARLLFSSESSWGACVQVLRSLQLLHSQRRRGPTESHVQHESHFFNTAFNMVLMWQQTLVDNVIRAARPSSSSSPGEMEIFRARLGQTEAALGEWTAKHANTELQRRDVYSPHFPLTRTWTRMVLALERSGGIHQEWFGPSSPARERVAQFALPPARMLHMMFQIYAGKWVRNGGAVMFSQLVYYAMMMPYDFLYVDLGALQILASVQGGDALMNVLLHVMCDDDGNRGVVAEGDEDEAASLVRAESREHVLRTVSAVVFDRSMSGNSPSQNCRRTVIHALAARDCTFSDLQKQLPVDLHQELEGVLGEVAQHHDASVGPAATSARYSLQKRFWCEVEFGGMYLRWSGRDEESALTRYRKAQHLADDAVPPLRSIPANTSSGFNGLIANVLTSPVLMGELCCALRPPGPPPCNPPTGPARPPPSSSFRLEMLVNTAAGVLTMRLQQTQLPALAPETHRELVGLVESEYVRMSMPKSRHAQLVELLLLASPAGSSSTPPSSARGGEATVQLHTSSASPAGSDVPSFSSNTNSPVPGAGTPGTATPSRDKASAKMAARQKKILRQFQQKQKLFADAGEEEGRDVVSADTSSRRSSPGSSGPTSSATRNDDDNNNGNNDDNEVLCSLCHVGRGNTHERSEELCLLIFRTSSNLRFVLEANAFEGTGRWIAVQGEGKAVVDGEPQTVNERTLFHEPRSLFHCIKTLHKRMNAGIGHEEAGSMCDAVNANRPLLHCCGHAVHRTCWDTYRVNLLSRSLNNEPFEGRNLIRVDLQEVCCPTCRRISNDILPMVFEASVPSGEGVARNEDEDEDQGNNNNSDALAWLKRRLEDFNMDGSPSNDRRRGVKEDEKSARARARAAYAFFSRFPFENAVSFDAERDPAALIANQLFTLQRDPSAQTIRSTIAPLVRVAVRHAHLGEGVEDEEAAAANANDRTCEEDGLAAWARFVGERFGPTPRKKRTTLLSCDMTKTLVQWLLLYPGLRGASLRDVVEEGRRVVQFLMPFAALQDALLGAMFGIAPNPDEDGADEYRHTLDADALRASALKTSMATLDDLLSRHRATEKERAAFQIAVQRVVDLAVDQDHSPASLHEALQACVALYVPRDCPPFAPYTRASSRRPCADALQSEASTLFELLLQAAEQETGGGRATATATAATQNLISPVFMKNALSAFFKDILDLVGGTDRPMCTAVTAARLLVSSILPSFHATPSSQTLIRLPHEYIHLMGNFLAKRAVCPACKSEPPDPALCLLCGTFVCSRSACNPEAAQSNASPLFMHGSRCYRGLGKSTGVFLFLRSSLVYVLMSEQRYCCWGSLYLDQYNEEDRGLARGVPLHLTANRMQALERAHATQSWFQDSRVLDQTRTAS